MPQMPPLSDDALKAMLSQPLVAKIATISSNGNPHISALWFEERDGDIFFNTWGTTRAARNLKQNPKAALLIDTNEFPYSGIHYSGTAVVEGPANDEEGMAKMFARYMGADVAAAKEYAGQLISMGERIYICFTPGKHVAWDFSQAS